MFKQISPFFFGAGIVLIIIVSVLGFMAQKHTEKEMADNLAEKGNAYIHACENILHSSIRHKAALRLQIILEEMSTNPDISFIAVTTANGTIIAHSDRARLGNKLILNSSEIDRNVIDKINPNRVQQYAMLNMENSDVFLVYRLFLPGKYGFKKFPSPIIFIGLNPESLMVTIEQRRKFILLCGLSAILVGILCFVALYYFQRAKESGKKQLKAENRVKMLEEEVQRKEKLAAIGNLAAGVAHEIRNPLSSIKGFATYFGQHFDEGSEENKFANIMVQEVDRVNRVVTELIGLSKPSDIVLVSVSPIDILDKVKHIILPETIKKNVNVKLLFGRNISKNTIVKLDSERIIQALLNLSLNSINALEDINTKQLTLACFISKYRIAFMVIDTGKGIDKKIINHIFDPFFTTKREGTGLGLALVHKIVEAHNGKIRVYSSNKGTRFTLLFNLELI